MRTPSRRRRLSTARRIAGSLRMAAPIFVLTAWTTVVWSPAPMPRPMAVWGMVGQLARQEHGDLPRGDHGAAPVALHHGAALYTELLSRGVHDLR